MHPRIGCKKLYHLLQPKLTEGNLIVGRDSFIDLMGTRGMHVPRKKKLTNTTYSKHGYAVSPNRIKELGIVRPNQVFVADITYLRTVAGFVYLFLVTDLYSRKIVGYDVRGNLSHEGAIAALEMAIEGVEDTRGLIHHTDRGSQYCCHDFLKRFKDKGIAFSNTDDSHVYQNAVAERVNGIIKDEYNLDATFHNLEHAKNTVPEVIEIYNCLRPHMSLKKQTPDQVYRTMVAV